MAAIRLLMLTVSRSQEVATLRWDDVDLAAGKLRLCDSKTGSRMVPLMPTGVQVSKGDSLHRGQPLDVRGAQAGLACQVTRQSLAWAARAGESSGRAAVRSAIPLPVRRSWQART